MSSPMRTVAVVPEGAVAVVAEHPVAIGKASLDEPPIEGGSVCPELAAMLLSPSADVINGEELDG